MTTQHPEALRLAGLLELAPEDGVEPQTTEDAAAPTPPAQAADSVQDLQPVHDAVTIDLLNERVAYLERKLQEADSVLEDAEQHEMDAKHAAIYRWMLGHVADVLSIFDNWLADEEADTDELHDALAARAAQEGK